MGGSERRLAAILFSDMVGYSALTQRNEALALQLVRESEGIIRAAVEGYGGREVKTLGDGFLAEFGSALNATECAIEIQRAIHEHNGQPGAVSFDLRVGIHLGDVEHRDGDILGDAVNIASRVEGLAEPGGVCLTSAVVEQVQNKVPYPCRELGLVPLKNIAQSMSVSRILLPWIEAGEAGLTPWTDRQRELQTLVSSIDATRRHQGRILFVRGEPGIGKTRLVQEALRHETSKTVRVLHGRALQGEPCPPFGYWAEAAREFFRNAPPALAFKVCGDCGAEVVKLVPELADRLGQLPSSRSLDPDRERLRFYEGISELFLNIAKESPLVVFFDDLQWGDTSSLRLLQYIARRLPESRLLIVATCRDYDPKENAVLGEVIEDLDRQHLGTSMAVPRLPIEYVEKIAQFILGPTPPTPHFTPLLFQKTGGNPFFLEEVLHSVLESGPVGGGAGFPAASLPELQLPENVRHVIHLRLGRLNPKTVDVLRIASVIGVEFPFEVLCKVTGESEETLLAALEEALQVRVLRERRLGGAQALYSFADDQIRDALYEEISVVRSQGYHRKVGEALEVAGVAEQSEGAEVLAHHFLRGNVPAKALRYFVRAGDRAAEVYAPEQAVNRYGAALDLLNQLPDEILRADVLDRQGTQFGKLGEGEAQFEAWEKAADGYRRAGHERKAGDLLRRLGTLRFRTLGKPEEGKRLLLEAQKLLEKGAVSPELVRLYLDLLDREEAEGNVAGAALFLVKALEVADRLNDPGVKAEIRVRRSAVPLTYNEVQFRQELAQHLEYGLSHDPEIALQAYWQFASFAALGRGDFIEARDWIRRGISFAEKTRNVHWAMTFKGVALAFASITLGDLATALTSLKEYYDFLEAHHQPPDGRNLRLLGEMALLRGSLEEAERWFERSKVAGSPLQPYLQDVLLTLDLARLETLRGEFDRAAERLSTAMPAVRTSSVKGLSWFLENWFLALLVEVLARRGEVERAAPFLSELEKAVRDIGSDAGRGLHFRAQGQCYVASGEPTLAARSLEQSVEAWAASGWALELARTQVELAEIYRTQGELVRARELAEKALKAFQEISYGPDFKRAKTTLDALATP